MEPVQEDELLLAEDDEGGVAEFDCLAEHEGPQPKADFLVVESSGFADGAVEAFSWDVFDDVFDVRYRR